MKKLTRLVRFLTLATLILSIVLSGCVIRGVATQSKKAPTKIVLKANGQRVKIPLKAEEGVEPREAMLKVTIKGDKLSLLISYHDSTPLKVGDVWEFDGQKWVRGPSDDTVGILWNIDNSIKGFNKKGFDVMTQGLSKEADYFDFKIVGKNPKRGLWAGYKQRGDYWVWCGVPEFYGKGDDNVFAIDPDYTKSPGLPAEIRVRHDAHLYDMPWVSNYTLVNGEEKPKYMLKPGLSFESNQRPFMDQMIEITDYSIFKKGDKVPPLIGIRGARWGGSKDDIEAKGKWSKGIWQIRLERKLNTGHNDDIQFKLGSNPSYYTFVVIIRDGGKGYAISPPISLQITR